MNLAEIDAKLMRGMKGINVSDGTYHPAAGGDPVDCVIAVDTLEIPDEFGIKTIRSGARITYLISEVGTVSIADRFEVGSKRYVVETKVPSQDPSMRVAHCRVETIA